MNDLIRMANDYSRLLQEKDALILSLKKNVERLRAILVAHHFDPDRCGCFPKGEQCALKSGHEGGCKWGRGD
jgi:hypothetical protein